MTSNIASTIDHTILRPNVTIKEIQKLCSEAREHGLHAVCLNPYWLADARKLLDGCDVKLCTVVGFPLGASLSRAKAHATGHCVEAGADEIDMVMNIGAALEGHWDFVEHEIHEVVSAAKGRIVKVIVEICYFDHQQVQEACRRAVSGGAHFVKTSTGFGPSGANVEVVELMRATVGEDIGVKASGGIRSRTAAEQMLQAGANRLGTSASMAILQGEVPDFRSVAD